MSANTRGALFMALSMALFALEDTAFKAATATLPVSTALLIFGGTGLALFTGYAAVTGTAAWHPAARSRPMLIRSAFELMGRLFFGLALAFAPLSSTAAILQAAPFIVMLGGMWVFGEKIGPHRWVALAIGVIGVLLVLRPTPESFEMTSLFALLATIGFAGRDLATRAAPQGMSNTQLGTLGFSVLIAAGLALIPVFPPRLPSGAELALAGLSGIVGVFAYTCLSRAMRTGEIGFVTPFRYTRILFALAIAVTLFNERPDWLTLTGAAIIVAAGLYSLSRNRT